MLLAQPASAETASVSYPPQAVTPTGATTLTGAIFLPGTGTNGFLMNFILPRNYARNRKVQIVLYLTSGAAKPCTARLVPSQLVRRRIGLNSVNDFSGFGPADGSPTVAFADNTVVAKIFNLKPGLGFPGQLRGDLIALGLARHADDVTDTCAGTVFVQGIDIRYPVDAVP
jgi:hypothetical protein